MNWYADFYNENKFENDKNVRCLKPMIKLHIMHGRWVYIIISFRAVNLKKLLQLNTWQKKDNK